MVNFCRLMQNCLGKNHNASSESILPTNPALLFTLHQNWDVCINQYSEWIPTHPKKHVHTQHSISFYKIAAKVWTYFKARWPGITFNIGGIRFPAKNTGLWLPWLIYKAAFTHFRRMIASGSSSKNCAVSLKHHKSYWCRLYCDTISGKSPACQTLNIIRRPSWDELRRLRRFPQPCRLKRHCLLLLKATSICSRLWGSATVSVRKRKSEANLVSKRTVSSRSRWTLIKEWKKKGSGLKESTWLDLSRFSLSQMLEEKLCNWQRNKKNRNVHINISWDSKVHLFDEHKLILL